MSALLVGMIVEFLQLAAITLFGLVVAAALAFDQLHGLIPGIP